MVSRTSRTAPSRAVARQLQLLTGREYILLAGRGAQGIRAALEIMTRPGAAVILPANTCYIVLWAVLKAGCRPLLADVDPATASLTVETMQSAGPAAAVIPCHMYGLPAPMSGIIAAAEAAGTIVIEDAALALGARIEGRPAGSWGVCSVLSFGLGKIVDHELGGALLTDDAALAREVDRRLQSAPRWGENLRRLTNQWHALYWALHHLEDQNPALVDLYPRLFELYGDLVSYRLPASHWAGLTGKLARLPDDLAHRAELATRYDRLLHGLPLRTLPRPAGSILWRYPLLVSHTVRDSLLESLWADGIHDVTRWYPSLAPMTRALTAAPVAPVPTASSLSASIINLRLDAAADESAVDRAASLIQRFLADGAEE